MTHGANKAGDGRHARSILLAAVISVALITFLTILGLMLWSRAVEDAKAPAAEGDGANEQALKGQREDGAEVPGAQR